MQSSHSQDALPRYHGEGRKRAVPQDSCWVRCMTKRLGIFEILEGLCKMYQQENVQVLVEGCSFPDLVKPHSLGT
jgi:hypothetical protein